MLIIYLIQDTSLQRHRISCISKLLLELLFLIAMQISKDDLNNCPCCSNTQKDLKRLRFLLLQFMDKRVEPSWNSMNCLPESLTLSSLIDSIEFTKKTKVRSMKNSSETESVSSCQSIENREKSKVWTAQEVELFAILLKNYGTDFHILSAFFPKKTKNQLKNRYKLYMNEQRKRQRNESKNLKAISQLFREVEEINEPDEKEDMPLNY